MKKLFIFLLFFISLLIIPTVSAHCPLCTMAVGAAAVSAQYYGLDIAIMGLLIGAFGVSTGLWFGLKITRKFIPFQISIIVIGSFLLTVIPLMAINSETMYTPLLFFGQAGSLLNKVYWVNKLLFGSIIGAIATIGAYSLHKYIKKVNGKVLFPFQGIAFTVTILAIAGSVLFFYLR